MTIRKVLLVDDDPSIRSIGNLSLRNLGKLQVLVAASGEEAVAPGAKGVSIKQFAPLLLPGQIRPLSELADSR